MKTEPTLRIYKPEETEAEQPAPLKTVKELGVRLRRRAGGGYDALVRDTGEVLGMVVREECDTWRGWAWQDAAQRYERSFTATRLEAVEELVQAIEAERQ